jgi:hypothetical protein
VFVSKLGGGGGRDHGRGSELLMMKMMMIVNRRGQAYVRTTSFEVRAFEKCMISCCVYDFVLCILRVDIRQDARYDLAVTIVRPFVAYSACARYSNVMDMSRHMSDRFAARLEGPQ